MKGFLYISAPPLGLTGGKLDDIRVFSCEFGERESRRDEKRERGRERRRELDRLRDRAGEKERSRKGERDGMPWEGGEREWGGKGRDGEKERDVMAIARGKRGRPPRTFH